MCDRRDAREAQNRAADTLTAVCLSLCTDEIGTALKAAYDVALIEPMPSRFTDLLNRLR